MVSALADGPPPTHTHTGVSSSASEFIPPPRPDELCFYDEDRDDVTDDFDDFEF